MAMDPWDRRAEEDAKAFRAFSLYAAIEPTERTYLASYHAYYRERHPDAPDSKLPVNYAAIPSTYRAWTKRYDWKERAVAWDAAKAKARAEGELTGITYHWATIASEKEKLQTYTLELAQIAHKKAKEIYEKELNKDNYSMAHAVQMSKFVLATYRELIEMEKALKPGEEGRWTNDDEEELSRLVARMDSEQAHEFFERARERAEDEGPPGSLDNPS